MKKRLPEILIAILFFAGICSLNSCQQTNKQDSQTTITDSVTNTTSSDSAAVGTGATVSNTATATSYKDASYTINGQPVKLTNGIAETEAAPGSASKITTKYYGNEITPDLNNDSRSDVVFFLTQATAGSGVFYYVVAALNKEGGYQGSYSLFLGDRITPQTITLADNSNIVVNYKDRKAGEGFSVQPSVEKSIRLKLDTLSMQFGEVAKDFEGEADPARMNPYMKTWEWINVTYNDGKSIKPKKERSFTITIKADGTFAATTDCNKLSGKVVIKNKSIKFSEIVSTRMYCEGSQEADFQKVLEQAAGYFFTSKGQMVIDLSHDSGSAQFR